jgi:hypothetical protein
MRILVISDLHAHWPARERVAYDVERTVRDLQALPVPAKILDRLISILRAGR